MDQRLPRKLAAVLYANVAGYSRLTGEDEDATHISTGGERPKADVRTKS